MSRCLPILMGVLLMFGCGEEPANDDIPGPPTAFDPARFTHMEAGILHSYLQLQDALAHDEFAAAQRAAIALAPLAEGELQILTNAAVQAADITALREAFRPLSEKVISDGRFAGLSVAYCPMAFNYEGGRWLQTEGDISNPYYGATMLRCGAFEAQENPVDGAG